MSTPDEAPTSGPASASPARPRWLWPLFWVNVSTLILGGLGYVAGFIGEAGEAFILAMIFPQVWVSVVQPWLGALIGALVVAVSVIAAVPSGRRGASFGRRFFTALTMTGFVSVCLSTLASIVLLIWATTSL